MEDEPLNNHKRVMTAHLKTKRLREKLTSHVQKAEKL